jgi:hypothetical protein
MPQKKHKPEEIVAKLRPPEIRDICVRLPFSLGSRTTRKKRSCQP